MKAKKDVVNIKEFDSTVVRLFVDYMYTGQIMISKENVQVGNIKILDLW